MMDDRESGKLQRFTESLNRLAKFWGLEFNDVIFI
jgi:hypothetical protein